MKQFFSRRWSAEQITSAAVVAGSTLMLLMTLHPELILRNNTPTGGDMGAHVYGPAYLRDFLLPHFRLTGWSNDWYSGFPMYRFYMVVPAIAVLLVDLILPYGIALKMIAVLGILTLPVCTWLFGKFAKFLFPIPELLTLASVVFLYDESFTIYGGNIASTMAGEFSFSISLSLAVLGFGLLIRAFREHRGKMITAVVIALSALSHGIVLLFVFGGVVLLAAVWYERRSTITATTVSITAVLLSSFWVLPFLTGHAYMTDMKYEPRPSGASDSFWSMYFPLTTFWDVVITGFAVIAFVHFIKTRNRAGIWMGVYCVVLVFGVYVGRESLPVIGLLWNPRLLPFLYLLRYYMMIIGIYQTAVWLVAFYNLQQLGRKALVQQSVEDIKPVEAISSNPKFNLSWITAFTVLVVGIIGFRFQEMPLGKLTTNDAGETIYRWGFISTKATNDGFVDGWARWNFTGYEGKSAYAEYRDVVETMKNIGQDPNLGCGRALWENNSELNKYGTTMSLMLLPHWTKGCIGSMEGLNFEAAGTTPYHFIAAAAMSKQSSNPVRELRYDDNNAGPWVIYEVADSDLVVPLTVQPVIVSSNSGDPKERWLEIGTSWFQHPEDWAAMPVSDGPDEWQKVDAVIDLNRRQGEPADPSRRVDIVKSSEAINAVELSPVQISNTVLEDEAISFTVDKVGVPVLVRMSYFPNWKVDNARGPFRVAPNMMVVIPSEKNVRLHYGYSAVDFLAYFMTLVGIGTLAVRWRGRQVARRRKLLSR